MKNVISFIIFIIYATLVFFLPNTKVILICILINLIIMFLIKINIKSFFKSLIKILPFILFTFIINLFLDNLINAFWIALKLIIVCNITIIYSSTTSILEITETIKTLCSPLKIFKIDAEDIKILVCISLSIIPILKRDLLEMKNACKVKGIEFNIKNMKYILSKFFLSIIMRTNQIEEALIAKGYNS